jgi:hypothetical protein
MSESIEDLASPQGERMAKIVFDGAGEGCERIAFSCAQVAGLLAGAWAAGYEACQLEFGRHGASARGAGRGS